MSQVKCPQCGGPAFCVDSDGFGFRCYNLRKHGGEYGFHVDAVTAAETRRRGAAISAEYIEQMKAKVQS